MAAIAHVSLLICDDHKILTDALALVVGLDEIAAWGRPVQTPEEAVEIAAEHAARRRPDGHRLQGRG